MPDAPPKACLACGKAQTDGMYCKGCRSQKPAQIHDDYRLRKEKEPWAAWYHRLPWTNRDGTFGIRRNVLVRDPICKICKRVPSTIADHIVPHKGDWKKFVDISNLEGLCSKCHDEKTARERIEAKDAKG